MNVVDQPGYEPTPEEEQLSGAYEQQEVFFRTNEAPGTIVIDTQERFLYLVQPEQPRPPLRHRRRPRRLPVAGHRRRSPASRNGRTGGRRRR